MKTVMIVTSIVDVNRRQGVINHIKTLGPWARISDDVWCVKTEDRGCVSVREDLSSYLDLNDKMIVVEITNSAWASLRIPQAVTSWLKGTN